MMMLGATALQNGDGPNGCLGFLVLFQKAALCNAISISVSLKLYFVANMLCFVPSHQPF
jgi:hypothetical protein